MLFATFLQPLVDLNDAILKFWHNSVGLSWGASIIGLTVVQALFQADGAIGLPEDLGDERYGELPVAAHGERRIGHRPQL